MNLFIDQHDMYFRTRLFDFFLNQYVRFKIFLLGRFILSYKLIVFHSNNV